MELPPSSGRGAADRWLPALLLVYSLGISSWMLATGLHVTMEDGYYYYKIAQNLAQGAGSTFDGIHLTNGYHPLWLFCLALVFEFVKGTRTALLYGSMLQAVFMATATVLVFRSARFTCGRMPALIAALLWVALTFRASMSGLEFSLYALMICITAAVWLRWFRAETPKTIAPYVGLGIAVSLTVLARLDSILLAIILCAALVWRLIRDRSGIAGWVRIAGFILPLLLTAIAYLTTGLIIFGHALPVSSAVKQLWSLFLLEHDAYTLRYGWLAAKIVQMVRPLKSSLSSSTLQPAVLGVFGASSIWLASLFVRKPPYARAWAEQTIIPLTPFVIYAITSYLSYIFTLHGSLISSAWYYAIQPWLAAMTAGALAELSIRALERLEPLSKARAGQFSSAALALVCLVCIAITIVPIFRSRSRELIDPKALLLYDAAAWAKSNLPQDAVIGTWNAGTIGYLSERRVINLDGVVNSWKFFENDQYHLCSYWDQENISYLLDVFQGDRVLTAVPLYPYYKDCTHRLKLIWQADQYSPDWSLKAFRIMPADE